MHKAILLFGTLILGMSCCDNQSSVKPSTPSFTSSSFSSDSTSESTEEEESTLEPHSDESSAESTVEDNTSRPGVQGDPEDGYGELH